MDYTVKSGKKPIELIFDNIHDHEVGIADLWIKEVEKRSGGIVHFIQYNGDGPKITETADVICDIPAAGGKYHLLDLVQIPFVFPKATVGSKVIAQLYAEFPELRSELSDFKIVGLGIGKMMAIFSRKSWGPVRTLEDLKGARTRSLLPIDQAIEALGAKPMHVDFLDITRLLEIGELDATVLGLVPAKTFHLAERAAPYCTIAGNLSITMHPMRTFMKWESWNKLPTDIQRIIDGLGPSGQDCWFAARKAPGSDRYLQEALEYFAKNGRIITLAPQELERWLNILQPLRDSAIQMVESKGLPGRKFFKRMLELVKQ